MSCAMSQLSARAPCIPWAGAVLLALSFPPTAACLPAALSWMQLWMHAAHFGRRRDENCQLIFFFCNLFSNAQPRKRNNNSAETFLQLRRCHCIWGKPELWGGCLSTGVLGLCSDVRNEDFSHGGRSDLWYAVTAAWGMDRVSKQVL